MVKPPPPSPKAKVREKREGKKTQGLKNDHVHTHTHTHHGCTLMLNKEQSTFRQCPWLTAMQDVCSDVHFLSK